MRIVPDCLPCFLTQALQTGRLLAMSPERQRALLQQVLTWLRHLDYDRHPPAAGRDLQHLVSRFTGNKDPYFNAKQECTRQALELYPQWKAMIASSSDRLETAFRVAAAGNSIDYGTARGFDPNRDMNSLLSLKFVINDWESLRKALKSASNILYLGDNAGETVFDRLLIEELNLPVTYVVRESPILNDAVSGDAAAAGLDRVAKVISSGCDTPGTVPGFWSDEFRDLLFSAELIISKGQGNYEGLSELDLPIFFLLKAKCRPVADDLGVKPGGLILKSRRP